MAAPRAVWARNTTTTTPLQLSASTARIPPTNPVSPQPFSVPARSWKRQLSGRLTSLHRSHFPKLKQHHPCLQCLLSGGGVVYHTSAAGGKRQNVPHTAKSAV